MVSCYLISTARYLVSGWLLDYYSILIRYLQLLLITAYCLKPTVPTELFGLYCQITNVCSLIFTFTILSRHLKIESWQMPQQSMGRNPRECSGLCCLGRRDVITLSPGINQSWAFHLYLTLFSKYSTALCCHVKSKKTPWLDMSQRTHSILSGWYLLGRIIRN